MKILVTPNLHQDRNPLSSKGCTQARIESFMSQRQGIERCLKAVLIFIIITDALLNGAANPANSKDRFYISVTNMPQNFKTFLPPRLHLRFPSPLLLLVKFPKLCRNIRRVIRLLRHLPARLSSLELHAPLPCSLPPIPWPSSLTPL